MPGEKVEKNSTLSTIHRGFNKMKKADGFPRPLFAEMHITNKCNINCYFCNQAELRRSNPAELSYDKIVNTLTELKEMGLVSVMFSGGGEPTLHRSFFDIIKFLNANDIILQQVITSGLIADKDVLDAMFSARWRNITFSLHASNGKDWRSMTSGPSRGFEMILNNIRYIIAERTKRGSSTPRVMLKFGVDINTWKKLTDAYRLACELRVDDVAITTYNHITYPDNLQTEIETILKQLKDIYAENEATGGVRTIGYYLADLGVLIGEDVGVNVDNGIPICFMPWYGFMIAASGDVRPCASGMEKLPSMGNINEESIRAIWNGRKYQMLRDMFEQAYFEKSGGICKKICAKLPDFCNPLSTNVACCPHMARWNEFYYRLIC